MDKFKELADAKLNIDLAEHKLGLRVTAEQAHIVESLIRAYRAAFRAEFGDVTDEEFYYMCNGVHTAIENHVKTKIDSIVNDKDRFYAALRKPKDMP